MKKAKWMPFLVLLMVGSLVVAACGPTTPEVIEKEVNIVRETDGVGTSVKIFLLGVEGDC